MDDERMRRAYLYAGRISRERMAREAPLDAAALAAVEASDVVVVPGAYDRVELVLEALELPFTTVRPGQLARAPLRPEQLLVVNCPGELPEGDLRRVRGFVEAGGSLFTTDWALRHVLEPAFPGVLAFNGRPTVLIRSRELEERYGEAAVAVVFRFGRGEVFHLISHYYLQRTELRGARHRESALAYAAARGVAADEGMADLLAGELGSAESSARFLSNLVAGKKRRTREGEPTG